MSAEPCVEFGIYFSGRTVGIDDGKDGVDAVVRLGMESLNFALALYDKSYCHTLHAPGRQCRLDFSPQNGRQFEAHQSVEYTPSLLSVH